MRSDEIRMIAVGFVCFLGILKKGHKNINNNKISYRELYIKNKKVEIKF